MVVQSIQSCDLEQFRDLLASNPKTNDLKISEQTLIQFLRSRDTVNDAYESLKRYSSLVNNRPELFEWKPTLDIALERLICYPYPVKTPEGRKIVVIRPGTWNPSELPFDIFIRLRLYFAGIDVNDDDVQRNGQTVIIDMRGLGWRQVTNIGLENGKLLSDLTEKVLPIRINQIHLIHSNRMTNIGFALFKPFMSDTAKGGVIFHGNNLDSLYKFIPKSCLPPSLGGEGPEFSGQYYKQWIDKHHDSLLQFWSSLKLV